MTDGERMLIPAEVSAKVARRAAFGVLLDKSWVGTGRSGSSWVNCRPASSKNGAHGGVCAPQPSPAGDHYLSGSQIAPPAARSRQIRGQRRPCLGERQECCVVLLPIV